MPGKYDSHVAYALRERKPIALVLREAGFAEREIRSCHTLLPRIKARIAMQPPEDWLERKRRCYQNRRGVVMQRLEAGSSHSEAGDVQLLESYDRALASLEKDLNAALRHSISQRLDEPASLL